MTSLHDALPDLVPLERNPATGVTERVSRILLAFLGTDGHVTLPALVERTGLPKSTTYRLVNDLVDYGLLERTPGGAVMPAMSVFELGLLAGRYRQLRESAAPVVQQLYAEFHQVVHLGVLEQQDVLYLLKIGGRPGSVVPTRDGGRFPAHMTGLGKAMVAWLPESEIEGFIGKIFGGQRPGGDAEAKRLRDELGKIRRHGIAFDSEEAVHGINCVAAPIFLPGSNGVAAISVTGPVRSFDLRKAATSVSLAAASVTRSLGVRRPPAAT